MISFLGYVASPSTPSPLPGLSGEPDKKKHDLLICIRTIYSLVGGIGRKLLCVRIYFGMLVFHLAFSVAAGIFAIYRVFKDSDNYISECLLGKENDPTALKTCQAGASLLKGLMVTVFIVFWMLTTCELS